MNERLDELVIEIKINNTRLDDPNEVTDAYDLSFEA